jgi:hypothetical protein
MSKLEQKILKDINLTEGFLTKVLAKIFKPRVDKTLKKLVKTMVNDPELQSILADMDKLRKDLEKTDRNYCKKRPQSPLCGKDGRRKPF